MSKESTRGDFVESQAQIPLYFKRNQMDRFRSLKDIEKEKYRLHLERELAQYKLNYFLRNAKKNWSPEKLIQNSIGSVVYRFVSGLIQKKEVS